MKTKLGISVSFMSALLYLGGLFGGYVVLALMAGYVLLKEEDIFLKRVAVKSVVICVGCSMLSGIIGLLPNLYSIISTLLDVFGADMPGTALVSLASFLQYLVTFAKSVVLLYLGGAALLNKYAVKDPLDPLVDKLL